MVPHITNEIKEAILKISQEQKVDVCIVEVGGTVGDIESLPFLEAIRQFRFDVGKDNTFNIHLTLIPYISAAGELKTKPTQKTVAELRGIGIQPDMILCRTSRELERGCARENLPLLQRGAGRGVRGRGRQVHLRGPALVPPAGFG